MDVVTYIIPQYCTGLYDDGWGIAHIDAQGDEGLAADLNIPNHSEDVTKIAEAIAAYLEKA